MGRFCDNDLRTAGPKGTVAHREPTETSGSYEEVLLKALLWGHAAPEAGNVALEGNREES